MPDPFDPSDPAAWLSRGRTPEHADAIASAWRTFPDLPADAPLADRMARGRERIAAMRSVNDAIAAESAAQRELTNFAFTEDQVRRGHGNDRDIAILRGHDDYCLSWDLANRYADGWYAAHVGWPHHYSDAIPCAAPLAERHAAYDRGFSDGGGDRTDLFDAARRSLVADMRRDNLPADPQLILAARPLPSSFPKPSDHHRPARWSRRLLILGADHIDADPAWDFLAMTLARPGAEAATIIVLTNTGFMDADTIDEPTPPGLINDHHSAADQLSALLQNREYDDTLIALQGADLALIDTVAHVLPLTRTMERTRNSRLQQRSHLRTWLDRGFTGTAAAAQGHIRWGKAITALYGSLGEFTARHIGPAPGRGHLVRVETRSGLANGFAAADGTPLDPEIIVSSKAKLRSTIAMTLRAFGSATRLMAAADRHAA